MLFSLIAIVVAAFAVVALIVSQMKTREELASLRGELTRVSAQAIDAAQQLKLARESLSAKKLEAPAAPAPVVKEPVPAPVPVAQPVPAAPAIKVRSSEEISPEILMVISAAVAAFLGKTGRRPRVVQSGINPWAQQGRVIVQASHNLGVVR